MLHTFIQILVHFDANAIGSKEDSLNVQELPYSWTYMSEHLGKYADKCARCLELSK